VKSLKPNKYPGGTSARRAPKKPWKMYMARKTGFTRQPVPSPLTIQDGSTTTTEKETANSLLHNFFPDVLPDSDRGKQKNKCTKNGSKVPVLQNITKLHGTGSGRGH